MIVVFSIVNIVSCKANKKTQATKQQVSSKVLFKKIGHKKKRGA